jgi:putative transcriptional regulator
MDEPLKPTVAKKLIRKILDACDLVIPAGSHADEEMRNDNLILGDVINVLKGGVVEPGELSGADQQGCCCRLLQVGNRDARRDVLEKEMKCIECGAEMTSVRENYNYKASGLPVTLANVEVRRCKECGEQEVVIPKIAELHKVIARAVVEKKGRLTSAEVRFLRTHLGWSGTDFAKHMAVAAATVSRWENGHEQMSPQADRLLRLMALFKQPVTDYTLDNLLTVDAAAKPTKIKLAASRGGWKIEAPQLAMA